MNPYDPLYPRPMIVHLRKQIQKLEKEVTEIDPIILEMDQLKRNNELILKEIAQIQSAWLSGCNKDDLAEQEIGDGIEAQAILVAVEKAESAEFPSDVKEKGK